jgi:DNA-3-methyladenine glycosylase
MGRRSVTAGRSSSRRARLGRAFFDRPTVEVARGLLGTELEVRGPRGDRRVRLVETEAYVTGDPASHAYRGPTPRNRSMFLAPGTLYVYRIHQVVCANLVTRRGEAVLLRAGAPLGRVPGDPSGPGRLCRYLGLQLSDDGSDTVRGARIRLIPGAGPAGGIAVGPRVGVGRAVRRRLRFALRGDPWVSRPRPWRRARRSRSSGT